MKLIEVTVTYTIAVEDSVTVEGVKENLAFTLLHHAPVNPVFEAEVHDAKVIRSDHITVYKAFSHSDETKVHAAVAGTGVPDKHTRATNYTALCGQKYLRDTAYPDPRFTSRNRFDQCQRCAKIIEKS